MKTKGSKLKTSFAALGALAALLLLPSSALAGVFELSLGFSFHQSRYTEDSFSWTRRWGTSVAYHFTERSGIEVSFQDAFERTFIDGFQDTNVHDRVLGLNWVQSLLGKQHAFQPFVKLGIGQLIRDIQGYYPTGPTITPKIDSVTGILGLGFRLFVGRQVAIRTEFTSHLEGGSIRTFEDNIAFSVGASVFF